MSLDELIDADAAAKVVVEAAKAAEEDRFLQRLQHLFAAQENPEEAAKRAALAAKLDAACTDEAIKAEVLADFDSPSGVVRTMSLRQAIAHFTEKRASHAKRARARHRAYLAGVGVPELHLRNVYDREPEPGEALSAAREFLDSEDVFLVLLGGVGTRKTGAACWWLAQAIDRARQQEDGTGALFLPVTKLVQAGAYGEDARDLRDELENSQLLVLDDIGAEYDKSGWFASHFSGLMDARYGSMLKTVITGNLTPEQFKGIYGERVVDRIREMGSVFVVAGGSQRVKPQLRLVAK